MKNGFTLAEILVVIVVLAGIGVILTEIFTRTLRSSNQSQIISTIKQNGQSSLDTMEKDIRFANQIITTCDSNSDLITDTIIIDQSSERTNSLYLRFRFNPPTPPANPTANGFISQDTVTIIPSDNINTVCSSSLAGYVSLTNVNSQSGVSVLSGASFSRSINPDRVEIRFMLGPPVGTPQTLSEKISPVEFKTTIEIR